MPGDSFHRTLFDSKGGTRRLYRWSSGRLSQGTGKERRSASRSPWQAVRFASSPRWLFQSEKRSELAQLLNLRFWVGGSFRRDAGSGCWGGCKLLARPPPRRSGSPHFHRFSVSLAATRRLVTGYLTCEIWPLTSTLWGGRCSYFSTWVWTRTPTTFSLTRTWAKESEFHMKVSL